jgi:cbb3-type cytochrome oxidase subunit 3
MLQELTANTGAVLFAIASTVFFFLVFAGVTVWVLTRRPGSYDAAARLPLEDDPPARGPEPPANPPASRTGGR